MIYPEELNVYKDEEALHVTLVEFVAHEIVTLSDIFPGLYIEIFA
jgi:hypothetical protein